MKEQVLEDQIIAAVLKMVNQLNRMEELPRTFGTDLPIHPSEIHTVAAIGNNRGCNISELAETLGISKPSVSEIVRKIEEKGLVERFKLPTNRKEVKLRLTEKGTAAYNGHKDFHREMYEDIRLHMEKIPHETLGVFKSALENICAILEMKIGEEVKP